MFEQALGDGEGQGGLACCSPWGHRESDTTERRNGTELIDTCEYTGDTKNGYAESEKVGLKLNIQKTKIMASGPIT